MTIYETIKAAISVKQAAEHYGLKVNRNGMACCPFHNDRHPSLKLNEDYFFCFGCGAKGDVIDLVARLFNLTSLQAAQKLASDFGLDPKPPTAAAMVKPKHPYIRQFREDEMLCFRVLTDYTDVERGERGSTEEHLTVTQFKVQAEQQRLEAVTGQVAQAEQSLEDAKAATEKQKKKLEALKKETQAANSVAMTAHEIESMGKKNPITGNITLQETRCTWLSSQSSLFMTGSTKPSFPKKIRCFYVGSRGRFDRLAATAAKRVKQRHPSLQLYLVLAYHPGERAITLTDGFDHSYYPPLENVPRRYAIVRANRYMIDVSDSVICYVAHLGNSRNLLEYAQQRKKKHALMIENVAETVYPLKAIY